MATSFTGAMKNFFGFLPGKGVTDFAKEIGALTYENKMEFHKMLKEQGIECDEPQKPAVKAA